MERIQPYISYYLFCLYCQMTHLGQRVIFSQATNSSIKTFSNKLDLILFIMKMVYFFSDSSQQKIIDFMDKRGYDRYLSFKHPSFKLLIYQSVNLSINSSNLSINSSNLSINSSNISIKSSNLSINSCNLFIYSSNISIFSSYISINSSNISINSSN